MNAPLFLKKNAHSFCHTLVKNEKNSFCPMSYPTPHHVLMYFKEQRTSADIMQGTKASNAEDLTTETI